MIKWMHWSLKRSYSSYVNVWWLWDVHHCPPLRLTRSHNPIKSINLDILLFLQKTDAIFENGTNINKKEIIILFSCDWRILSRTCRTSQQRIFVTSETKRKWVLMMSSSSGSDSGGGEVDDKSLLKRWLMSAWPRDRENGRIAAVGGRIWAAEPELEEGGATVKG